ncbi:MAG: HD-GYP domain-containing protein [Oleiphilaceae bacterium]|nr:HD-GYP domain-containing protein [Oleiphilaceae bacterium]
MAKQRSELKVPVSELALGMRVIRLDRPWLETDFLMQGFVIHTQDEIEDLIRQCEYVYVEAVEKAPGKTAEPATKNTSTKSKRPFDERRKEPQGLFARFRKPPLNSPKASTKKPPTTTKPLSNQRPLGTQRVAHINKIATEKELTKARVTYTDAKQSVKSIMDGIRIGHTLDINQSRKAVNAIVDSIIRNKDALVWLTKIKQKDEYTAEHSLNVCVLTATFARYLGHSDEEIRQLALCALLHDVGKSKVPDEILNKEGRFTDKEFEIMKQHTTYGRDLLMNIKDADRIAIDVAHSHHERMDGSGYPRGLTAHQIPYYAKVVALADCYDAITSSRCYDGARASMEALDIIYKCRGVQFDEELALEFIKCIGLYPPGAIVELNNGEVGIIISTRDDNKLRPRILIVRDAAKQLCRERIIDLAKDPSKQDIKIVKEVPNGTYSVDIRVYLAKGLVIDTASMAGE